MITLDEQIDGLSEIVEEMEKWRIEGPPVNYELSKAILASLQRLKELEDDN